MSQPEIGGLRPFVSELEAGTYHWCACGRSKNQPWCDGSHAGTEFQPMAVTLTEKKRYAFCTCKHTKTPPFCDGTHKTLSPTT